MFGIFTLEPDQISRLRQSADGVVAAFRRGAPYATQILTSHDPEYNVMRRLGELMKDRPPPEKPSQLWPQVEAQAEADALLAALYHYARTHDIDKGSQYVFRRFDDFMSQERFDVCDWVLSRANVKNLQEDLIFALVAITRPAKHKIPCRAQYMRIAERRMAELVGDEEAKALFADYA